MISIVLYGRNDNYGYNLHKRAALSLNCMAEVLTDSADEILFVDYNTPDDFPTFPEAIQDTLTGRARKLLRVLRVRPRIHQRFKSKTHLLALEPIARNIAVRRSSARNRWILSTNTDMIFVPLQGSSLSNIVRELAPGFYHAPRLEIPEVLWESLDRNNPVEVINTVRQWGTTLHLNEIVLGSKFILYDGPGDFQLLLRDDLFENNGFDEDMLLGWHVDSNIAARMRLKYTEVGDLGHQVYGYHCDHTRQVTPAHSHTRIQNDWRRFVIEVARPDVPGQAGSWGCADDTIEEVHLPAKPAGLYVQALSEAIGDPLARPNVVQYTGETYNKVDYDARHLLPFLADMFVTMPRTSNVAWYGIRAETLSLFATIWDRLNFTGMIFSSSPALQRPIATSAISQISSQQILKDANAYIFDFGGLPPVDHAIDEIVADLRRRFRQVVRAERRRVSEGGTPRRIIALNAINNEYEGFVCGSVAAAATPFSTHMRHGFVLPTITTREEWLPLLSVGEAGIRVGSQIKSDPTKRGWIAFGPFKYLDEGNYTVSINIELSTDNERRLNSEPCIFIEAKAGSELLALHLLRYGELGTAEHKFTFVVSRDVADGVAGIETRVAALIPIAVAIRSLSIEPSAASVEVDPEIPVVLRLDNWLPFLQLKPRAQADEDGVVVGEGEPDYAVYGPYWALPPGRYELIASVVPQVADPAGKPLITIDVSAEGGARRFAEHQWRLGQFERADGQTAMQLRLPFVLAADLPPALRIIETRIFAPGDGNFRVRSLVVRPRSAEAERNWFPYLTAGECGLHGGGEIKSIAGRSGCIASTPAMQIEPGHYHVSLDVVAASATIGQPDIRLEIWCGLEIIALGSVASDRTVGFDAPPEVADSGIELRLWALTSAAVSVRNLVVERTSEAAAPNPVPPVLRLDNWLPFLQLKPRAQADVDGVVVGEGEPDYAVYGPYWALPPGRYELIASVVPRVADPAGKPLITIDVSTEGGARRFAEHQWRLGQFERADGQTAMQLRLPFVLAADLPPALRTIETRIFAPGDGNFRVRSLVVRPSDAKLNRNHQHEAAEAGDFLRRRGGSILRAILPAETYALAAKMYRKLRTFR